MLSNETLVTKIGFDTTWNGPIEKSLRVILLFFFPSLELPLSLLLHLLEDHEAQLPFRRRLRNAKLPRSAVMWTRVIKKALLLLRNNRAPVRDLLSEHEPYL